VPRKMSKITKDHVFWVVVTPSGRNVLPGTVFKSKSGADLALKNMMKGASAPPITRGTARSVAAYKKYRVIKRKFVREPRNIER